MGIDIGGTHLRWGIVEDKNVLCVEKIKSKDIDDFVEYISKIALDHPEIDVISIGIPGIVNNHKIMNVPNVEKLNVYDLKDQIEERTKKLVLIHRDVRLLFAYDLERLSLEDKPYVLAFYLGTGIGNVIKVEGQIVKGRHGFSAELGHIPITGNDKICGCGKVGCAETIVSGKALLELFHSKKLSGDFSDIFIQHKNHPLIHEFIEAFARIIAIEMNILDATTLIIGGGVANMIGFPQGKLNRLLASHLRSDDLRAGLHIHYVDDSPMNSMIGASLIAKEYINENSHR
ncbi:MAG: ROK family protein [Candidatus Izemoplasmatales bacterium]